MTFSLSLFAQVEMKYNANAENLPEWVQLMYADNPDEGEVIKSYTDYYKTHELVKNKHTQYYKRWLRGISRFSNAKPTLKTSKSSNQWECVGPWDFDKDAARCKECGCYMRLKVNLADTKCPIGKWDSTN